MPFDDSAMSARALAEPGPPALRSAARCPLCFSRRQATARRWTDAKATAPYRVVRCVDCGLEFTNPRPHPEDWRRFYPDDYAPFQTRQAPRSRRNKAESLLDGAPRFPAPFGEGALLDVGCGGGDYLARMQRLGWKGVGLERSSTAAQRAQSTHGLSVLVGELPHQDLEGRRFDLVTAWEVLEHLERPRPFLESCRELLKTTGLFALSVPNQAGWAARRFGPDWFGLDLPRHLLHFTPETAQRMLSEAGFAVAAQRTSGHPSWIRKSAKQARSQGRWTDRLLERRLVSGIASRIACRRGAGESIVILARRCD